MDEEELKSEPKYIATTIVKYGEKQSVIQWIVDGIPYRATLKNMYLREDFTVDPKHLEKAIPYGLDFKDIVTSVPDVRDVENAFHGHGIWTIEDVKTHPDWVLAALSSIYSPILKSLMQYIKAKKI